jgi:hypothetical protein
MLTTGERPAGPHSKLGAHRAAYLKLAELDALEAGGREQEVAEAKEPAL